MRSWINLRQRPFARFPYAGRQAALRHQFIELGHDLQPLRISEQFGLVLDTMIEYCAGLARFKNRYLLSFGLNDSTPFIMEMGEKAVERLLVPFAAPFTENESILSASPE